MAGGIHRNELLLAALHAKPTSVRWSMTCSPYGDFCTGFAEFQYVCHFGPAHGLLATFNTLEMHTGLLPEAIKSMSSNDVTRSSSGLESKLALAIADDMSLAISWQHLALGISLS